MKKLLILALILLNSGIGLAQYKLDQNLSSMYIDGTSTLHDWTSTVEQISGTLHAEVESNTLQKLRSINISVPVKSIKSGKSGMDKNTYNALDETNHPMISFKLKTYSIGENELTLNGELTIAGTTRMVKIKTPYEMSENRIEIEGDHSMKMTDFDIEPPTAVMGTIKTGDEIVVRYNLVFVQG
jgi:polyisoprenoid-binding protein YceI